MPLYVRGLSTTEYSAMDLGHLHQDTMVCSAATLFEGVVCQPLCLRVRILTEVTAIGIPKDLLLFIVILRKWKSILCCALVM